MSSRSIRRQKPSAAFHHAGCRRIAARLAALCALGVAVPSLAESIPIDYPDSGVEIGQGWDTQKVSPILGGSCVHFTVGRSQTGQATSVKLTEVSDREQLMRAIDGSAAFSVKTLTGSKVSGRSNFAKSAQLSSTWSSFAAQAIVDNGSLSAAGPPVATEAALEYRRLISDPRTAQSPKLHADALQKSPSLNAQVVGREIAARIPKSTSPSLAERLSALTLEAINGGVVRRKGMPPPAPQRAAAGSTSAGSDGDPWLAAFPGKIVLRKEYRDMAEKNPDQFRQVCGDSFVVTIREGAEIDGLVTFLTTSRAEQIAISASASGAGAGFAASGAFAEKMKSFEQKQALNLAFVRTGGISDPIPTDRDGVVKAISQLAVSAHAGPYRYSFTTAPYDTVPNWPRGNDDVDAGGFVELARAYGKWETLYEDVSAVLSNAAEGAPGSKPDLFLNGRTGASYADLATMQETAMTNIRSIVAMARDCTNKGGTAGKNACTVPAAAAASDMPYRAKLPLPVAIGVAPLEALESDTELKARVVDYWLKRVNTGRCSFDKLTAGYCLSQNELNVYAKQVPVGQTRAIVFLGYNNECLSTNGRNAGLLSKACDLSKPIPATQKWLYDKDKQAIYQNSIDKKSRYCVDVANDGKNDGTGVLGWDCGYGANQQFSVELVDTQDAVQIRGKSSDKCVDVRGPVAVWPCNKNDTRALGVGAQKFRMVLVEP